MDLVKIGTFLQTLRKEKGLTQEQLAEQIGVARRTVSRWETGSNMPDLDLLIEMADLYEVDLRELLDGERKEKMDKEMEETVLQVAEYSSAEKERAARIMRVYFLVGIAALIANAAMNLAGIGGTFWTGFLNGMTFGLALIAMVMGVLYTTGTMAKILAFKTRLLKRGK